MPTYPNDADGDALARLAAMGADMSRPVLLEFAVDAPDERSAEAIERALTQHGYRVRVEYDEGEPDEDVDDESDEEGFGPSWTVYADVTMVPAYDDVVRVQAELDRITGPFGGRSDGWGTLMEPDSGP